VRVIAGNSERVYSLTLPELWEVKWTPPANAATASRRGPMPSGAARTLWPFLAGPGCGGPAGEWIAVIQTALGVKSTGEAAYTHFAPAVRHCKAVRIAEARMTFERAWALFSLFFPLAWLAWEWRRQVRRTPC
jgi:hypothetical protein